MHSIFKISIIPLLFVLAISWWVIPILSNGEESYKALIESADCDEKETEENSKESFEESDSDDFLVSRKEYNGASSEFKLGLCSDKRFLSGEALTVLTPPPDHISQIS